jgi:ribosomal protein S18 acetylase RimI-like enzyme
MSPTTDDPGWVGTLPPYELTAFGLELPWDGDPLDAGTTLFAGAAAHLAGTVPDEIQLRANPDHHGHVPERLALFEALGLELFQEKEGFRWSDDGVPVQVPGRLRFPDVDEVGREGYAAVMAACGEGTLDRTDRHYWGGCGPGNWAAQMMAYLQPVDTSMWLLGAKGTEPVGYVAVGSDDAWGSTIVHIGVLPRHRGKGYARDLVLAGTRAAQRAGIPTMLSDVDALNEPMKASMRACGHHDHPLWHVWEYRGPLERT